MLYVYGFFGLFLIGGLTGLFLATLGTDIHLHDTYFVVAHFHYIMVGGAIMGYLGGLHFWWPKIFGRMYSEFWSRIAAILVFVGFNLTFFPQFLLGYLGMPRRYHMYPDEFQVLNVLSSAGASILGLGYLHPGHLFRLVAEVRRSGRQQPVGRVGPRVAHPVAAAHRELHGSADRHPGSVRIHTARSFGRPSLSNGIAHAEGASPLPGHGHAHAHHPALQHHFDTMSQQREAGVLGMWVFLLTEVLFFGGLFFAYAHLPQLVLRGVRRGEQVDHDLVGPVQHGGAHRQLAHDGPGGARAPRPTSAKPR